MAISCKGAQVPKEVIFMGVRWYVAYPLSTRHGVDQTGQTIDFLLTEHRDEKAAKRFLTQAIRRHGRPAQSPIEGSEAKAAASRSYNPAPGTAIVIRQAKYLTNVSEQDQRAGKRMPRPMLGGQALDAAQGTLAGVELMHMLKKTQRVLEIGAEDLSVAEQCYALAA